MKKAKIEITKYVFIVIEAQKPTAKPEIIKNQQTANTVNTIRQFALSLSKSR